MYQDLLLKQIRSKIGDKSLNDEIANILNISYDAAHRRTSLKAKFSMEEAVELAKYYQISLDQFLGTEHQLVVQRTQPVKSADDLQSYFDNSLKILSAFQNTENSKVYYSAKDIPFFYTIGQTELSRFKFYVWMNLLNQDKFLSPFRDFRLDYHSPKNESLQEIYKHQKITEIWNETTITSLLMQISFYHEIGMLKNTEASLILDEVVIVFNNLEERLANDSNYEIYVNDLVILNNSILFDNDQQSSLFIPYSMFGYMMTSDKATCSDAVSYFEHQIKNSKSLKQSGNRDRKLFFNKMYEQIESLRQKL